MLNTIFCLVMLCWLTGIVFGLYCVVLSINARVYYTPTTMVFNGERLTLKQFYNDFVDNQ
jgi:hypothetical protein